ncbi:MAG: hypothetical protein H8E14_14285 [Candidatus Marinimicrobia bacterium]|nr:hypothetical protein [Candidatus Neomarinimicrobiota bacterium]
MTIKLATLVFTPLVLLLFCLLGLIIPATIDATLWLLKENHPVELLTFISLLAAGILGIRLIWLTRQTGEAWWISIFFTLFTIAILFTAMEEIAWGQWFFGFDTPEVWRDINRQDETTFHNIGSLQGHTEILRVIFGLGGLIGLALNWLPKFKPIAVPQALWLWFIIIAGHASIDYYNDFYSIGKQFDWVMMKSSEFLEMLIGMAGFLYVSLHWKFRVKFKTVTQAQV